MKVKMFSCLTSLDWKTVVTAIITITGWIVVDWRSRNRDRQAEERHIKREKESGIENRKSELLAFLAHWKSQVLRAGSYSDVFIHYDENVHRLRSIETSMRHDYSANPRFNELFNSVARFKSSDFTTISPDPKPKLSDAIESLEKFLV